MKKAFILLLLAIVIMLTGCYDEDVILKAIDTYAVSSVGVMNELSKYNGSAIINSSCAEDSIRVEYQNKAVGEMIINIQSCKMELIYTSDSQLSVEEIETLSYMMYTFNFEQDKNDLFSTKHIRQIENFVNTGDTTIIDIDDNSITLERFSDTISIKVACPD